MASYRTLKSVFHQFDEARAKETLEARRNSEAALHWNFSVDDHQLFVLCTPELLRQVESIGREQSKLEKKWTMLPREALKYYLRTLLIDEIQATNEIESIRSTRQELSAVLEAVERQRYTDKRRFAEMVKQFSELSLGRIDMPSSASEVRVLYDRLLAGELDPNTELDGEIFRVGPVMIATGTKEIHRGFATEPDIVAGLHVALAAMHPDRTSHLISHIMAHFMFETIHPFYDGNGRMGRFLLVQGLSECLSVPTALTLSKKLNEQKQRYYRAFAEVQNPMNYADGTFFALELLELLFEAQLQFHDELDQRIAQIAGLSQRISELKATEALPGANARTYDLLKLLGLVSLFGWPKGEEHQKLAAALEVSPQTLRTDEAHLVTLGYVEETSKRPLMFKLSESGTSFLQLEVPNYL